MSFTTFDYEEVKEYLKALHDDVKESKLVKEDIEDHVQYLLDTYFK